MDDLSRVRRAAFAATNFDGFRQKLLNQENLKAEQHETYESHRHPFAGDAPPGPRLVSRSQAAILHTSTCATTRDRTKTQGSVNPCDCGAARKHRQMRADMIEAHLDCAGTMTHRNALELRDHWYQTERELTDALEQIEKLSDRINARREDAP